MKNIFLTLVGVAMLTTVTLAQSTQQSAKDKNPDTKTNSTKKEEPAQDTIRNSKQSDALKGPGVGAAESNESNNKSGEKETVTQKEKRNKPGNRSQTDEDETGKKPKKSDKDKPE